MGEFQAGFGGICKVKWDKNIEKTRKKLKVAILSYFFISI